MAGFSSFQTRSGRQLEKTFSEQYPILRRARKPKSQLNEEGKKQSWINSELHNDHSVTTDSTHLEFLSYANCPASKLSITEESMEVQERHTVGNTVDNPPLFDSEKDLTEHKRTRRTRARHTSMLERLAPTPGYVDKTPVDFEGGSLAQRRTPRMASLNAAAKVNVFFEPSSPLAGRSMFEIQQHATKKPPGRLPSERKLSDRSNSSSNAAYGADIKFDREDFPETDVFLQSEVTSTWDPPAGAGVIVSPKGLGTSLDTELAANNLEFVPNGHKAGKENHKRKPEADSTSEGERKTKRIFLEGSNETDNTAEKEELFEFEDEQEDKDIECDTTTDSPPKTMKDACIQVDLPRPPLKHVRVLSVPIKGQLVTSGGPVPFTKSHLVTPVTPSKPPPELKMSKTATTKRAVGLNHQAMENVFSANDGPLGRFKSVGGLLHERNKARKAKEFIKMPESSSSVKLKIPKINFAATSTSTMSAGRSRPAGNPLKSIQLKNLNIHLEKLAAERARAEPKQPKVCTRKARESRKDLAKAIQGYP